MSQIVITDLGRDMDHRREWQKIYDQTPERKEKHRLYDKSPARKIAKNRYNKSELGKKTTKAYNKKHYPARKTSGYYTKYREMHPERQKEASKRYIISIRHRANIIVGCGIIKCANCGCNREEMLQINHKNGGGTKERRETGGNSTSLCVQIVRDKRGFDDLELRCFACNAFHYMERKYGKLPMRIIWDEKDGTINGPPPNPPVPTAGGQK